MFIAPALLLGLLVALNPCQLAINLSALTYLSNRSENKQSLVRKGWLYVAGRSITYTVLGVILTWLIQQGKNIEGIQALMSKGEAYLPYLLLIIGNRYRIESMSRDKAATEERINYLREQRIQMQKQYQQSVKMSQIADDLKETGVGITAGPPYEL